MGTSGARASEDIAAAMFGMKLVTMPYHAIQDALALSAGVCIFTLVRARVSGPVTTLGCWLQTSGVTPSGVNGLALYTVAGVKLQKTASMDTEFAAAPGHKEKAITSVSVVEGTNYYQSVLAHFSGTSPKIMGAGTAAGVNFVPVNGVRPSVFLTAQADFPDSFDPTAATANSGSYFMTAR